MAITIDVGSISSSIQQQVPSGSSFNGTYPTGTPILANATYKFPIEPSNGSGLFYWDTGEPVLVTEFSVYLGGGGGDVSLYLINMDDTGMEIAGEDILINSQTGITYLHLDGASFRMTLLTNQAFKLVTSSVSYNQIARAVGHLERSMYK